MDSSVEAESIQVGSGFLAFEDMSRGFYNLAALFAISIPVLVFPIPNLISWPSFPEKKSVDNITVSSRFHTRVCDRPIFQLQSGTEGLVLNTGEIRGF